MNTRFWTKKDLYSHVDELRQRLKCNHNSINSIDIAKLFTKNLLIFYPPFQDNTICGILYRGKNTTSIALNSSRSEAQQNFDCMHELIHYFLHDVSFCRLICSDSPTHDKCIDQDFYIEWQANEGAAQFLVPYQIFIPDYIQTSCEYSHCYLAQTMVIDKLAAKYFVSPKVIRNRIDSLNYEIYSYMQDTPISQIKLYSKRSLKDLNWNKRHEKTYCRTCSSPVNESQLFCHVCGRLLYHAGGLRRLGSTNVGAGYMKYSGIPLRANGKVIECPVCHNEEIDDGEYCKICGTVIVNKCNRSIEDFEHGEIISPCFESQSRIIPGNARYCPYCGGHTTFFDNKLLPPIEDAQKHEFDNNADLNDDPNFSPLPF